MMLQATPALYTAMSANHDEAVCTMAAGACTQVEKAAAKRELLRLRSATGAVIASEAKQSRFALA